jgi:hypothetical protein
MQFLCDYKLPLIVLSHARTHRRKQKGRDREEHANIEVGGCFGKITEILHSKKS